MAELVYTVAETAKLLKLRKNTVYALIKKGLLIGLDLGCLKVPRFELIRFLKDYNGMDLSDLDNIKPLHQKYQKGEEQIEASNC